MERAATAVPRRGVSPTVGTPLLGPPSSPASVNTPDSCRFARPTTNPDERQVALGLSPPRNGERGVRWGITLDPTKHPRRNGETSLQPASPDDCDVTIYANAPKPNGPEARQQNGAPVSRRPNHGSQRCVRANSAVARRRGSSSVGRSSTTTVQLRDARSRFRTLRARRDTGRQCRRREPCSLCFCFAPSWTPEVRPSELGVQAKMGSGSVGCSDTTTVLLRSARSSRWTLLDCRE